MTLIQLINEVREITSQHRLVDDRVEQLLAKGYNVQDNVRMGSGGVGQVKEMKDHYRVQVSYGVTNNNYAWAVIIPKHRSNRYVTRELVVYRKSSMTRDRHFDNLDEAIAFVEKQRDKHPRTRKLTHSVWDSLTGETHRV